METDVQLNLTLSLKIYKPYVNEYFKTYTIKLCMNDWRVFQFCTITCLDKKKKCTEYGKYTRTRPCDVGTAKISLETYLASI